MTTTLVVLIVLVLVVLVTLAKTVRIVPQARAYVVERLGRYQTTLTPGLNLVIPFIDRVREAIDLREQVVSFPPNSVITKDNLSVHIDTVIYFQVTSSKDATYEIANYIQAIEQITVTTLRNVIGSMDLEGTLTSRDSINQILRGELDEATGRWGIRVNRVEIKAIEPPASIKDAMEKQLRAEREKRASILQAQGEKESAVLRAQGQQESQVLQAEGARQANVLAARGEKESAALRAEGEAQAIATVFEAIHTARPDEELLAYQYLQMLPKIAQGDANKVWVLPAELTRVLGTLGALGNGTGLASGSSGAGSDAGASNGSAASHRDPAEGRPRS